MNFKGAVFFDYDGTLVDETAGVSTPSKYTRDALNALQQNGYLVGLCTGRAKCYLPENLNYNFDCYITTNGSYAEVQETIVYSNPFSSDILKRVIQFLEENNMNYFLESPQACYCYNFADVCMTNMLIRFRLPLKNFFPIHYADYSYIHKLMITSNQAEKIKEFQTEFQEHCYVSISHGFPRAADVGRIDVSKGLGIQKVLESMQIRKENTFAFGDGPNDIEMFKTVGTGIAMKNHDPALEKYAAYITDAVANEGIANALKKFSLI